MNTDNGTPIGQLSAGQRLRGMRELMGMDRKEFAELLGFDYSRLTRIELGKQAMHDVDFERVLRVFPHFSHWLTYAGPIDIDSLAAERDKLCKITAVKLQVGEVPVGYGLEKFTDHGTNDQ